MLRPNQLLLLGGADGAHFSGEEFESGIVLSPKTFLNISFIHGRIYVLFQPMGQI
jgi:hypothetical protein